MSNPQSAYKRRKAERQAGRPIASRSHEQPPYWRHLCPDYFPPAQMFGVDYRRERDPAKERVSA
jgi:hypothetical protein